MMIELVEERLSALGRRSEEPLLAVRPLSSFKQRID